MLQYACVACPEDCDVSELGLAENADCIDALELKESEVCDLFISLEDPNNPGEALFKPTDINDAGDWASAIDNDLAAAIKHFSGIGDVPEPEVTEAEVFKRQTKITNMNYTLNFDVQHRTQVNYEFARRAQCGLKVRFWFATIGGELFGGDDGIGGNLTAVMPLERGEGSYANILFRLNWNAKCDPPRILNPMAEVNAGE